MSVSPADFELYSRATGAPYPRTPDEKMRMAPEVYRFTRSIATRPNFIERAAGTLGKAALMGGAAAGLGALATVIGKTAPQTESSPSETPTDTEIPQRELISGVHKGAERIPTGVGTRSSQIAAAEDELSRLQGWKEEPSTKGWKVDITDDPGQKGPDITEKVDGFVDGIGNFRERYGINPVDNEIMVDDSTPSDIYDQTSDNFQQDIIINQTTPSIEKRVESFIDAPETIAEDITNGQDFDKQPPQQDDLKSWMARNQGWIKSDAGLQSLYDQNVEDYPLNWEGERRNVWGVPEDTWKTTAKAQKLSSEDKERLSGGLDKQQRTNYYEEFGQFPGGMYKGVDVPYKQFTDAMDRDRDPVEPSPSVSPEKESISIADPWVTNPVPISDSKNIQLSPRVEKEVEEGPVSVYDRDKDDPRLVAPSQAKSKSVIGRKVSNYLDTIEKQRGGADARKVAPGLAAAIAGRGIIPHTGGGLLPGSGTAAGRGMVGGFWDATGNFVRKDPIVDAVASGLENVGDVRIPGLPSVGETVSGALSAVPGLDELSSIGGVKTAELAGLLAGVTLDSAIKDTMYAGVKARRAHDAAGGDKPVKVLKEAIGNTYQAGKQARRLHDAKIVPATRQALSAASSNVPLLSGGDGEQYRVNYQKDADIPRGYLSTPGFRAGMDVEDMANVAVVDPQGIGADTPRKSREKEAFRSNPRNAKYFLDSKIRQEAGEGVDDSTSFKDYSAYLNRLQSDIKPSNASMYPGQETQSVGMALQDLERTLAKSMATTPPEERRSIAKRLIEKDLRSDGYEGMINWD